MMLTADILLGYQGRWISDPSAVRFCLKSRRIGVTWAEALRAVLAAAESLGRNQFYIGYNLGLAEEFIRTCEKWAMAVDGAAAELGEELWDSPGGKGDILVRTIRFASGFCIYAMASRPKNLRGMQGDIIIDEAAFHPELEELLKAALALLMWGGRVAVISTHNGHDSAFARFVADIEAGKKDYSLHVITIDDAIRDGLYDRIAEIRGLPNGVEAQRKWREEIFALYGEDADEELLCIPRRSGGVFLAPSLIDSCASEECEVVRLELTDDFVSLDEVTRRRNIKAWVHSNLGSLSRWPAVPAFIGEDFGRRSDLTVMAIGRFVGDVLNASLLVELRNVPFEAQKDLLFEIVRMIPRLAGAAFDSTGNGAYLAEVAAQQLGPSIVDGVALSEKWYAENLPRFKAMLETRRIAFPDDADVRSDLRAFQVIDGVPRLPKQKHRTRNGYRHGDAAIALALLEYASKGVAGMSGFRYERVERGGAFGFKGML